MLRDIILNFKNFLFPARYDNQVSIIKKPWYLFLSLFLFNYQSVEENILCLY